MLDIDKNKYTVTFLKEKGAIDNVSGKIIFRMAPSKHKIVVEMLDQMMQQGVVKEWALDNYTF